MRQFKHVLKNSLGMTVCSALVLASCASTGTGQSYSTLSSGTVAAKEAPIFDESDLGPGDGLILIRYPAFIDDAAKGPFFDQYGRRTIGDKSPDQSKFLANAEQLAGAFMLKNHYFAVSVYKALKERLPADTVFLSPHIVKYDLKTGLTSEPLLSSEAIPHALTIDFSTYTYPDSDVLLKANATTFGDLVTPLAVVRTNHRALPQTNGLLAASAPLMSTAWSDARTNIQTIDLASPAGAPDSHILVDFIDGQRTLPVATNLRITEPVRRKVNPAKIDVLPVEKIKMDSGVIKRLSRTAQGLDADPFGPVYADSFADRVIAYLNVIDIPKATAAAKQQAIANFDYDAAHLYFAAADNRGVQNRIDFADRLLKAERRYLAGQSEGLEASMGPEQFGRQLAELFVAEQENLEQQRELARQQNNRTMLAIFAAMAAAGATYGSAKARRNGNTGADVGYSILAAASLGAVGYGLIGAQTKKAQRKMASANFLASITPSLEKSNSVTVELVEGTEEITAANYPELREKMLSLYRTRLRSMEVSAVPCTFSSPQVATLGTWYGPCADGQATGNGYGAIVAADAGKIEYFGEADAGFASGAGYLVVSSPDGRTVAYEGGFLSGRPHGPVEMTATGKAPKTGLYENGQRVGRLPSGVPIPQALAAAQGETYGAGR